MKSRLTVATEALGQRAVVEFSQAVMNGATYDMWRVGVRGRDSFSWTVLGQSAATFEQALARAVKQKSTGR